MNIIGLVIVAVLTASVPIYVGRRVPGLMGYAAGIGAGIAVSFVVAALLPASMRST